MDYGSCTYPYVLSLGQTLIISKRQGLCRIKLCGLQDLRPAVCQDETMLFNIHAI